MSEAERARMVREQLVARGVRDARVLDAMRAVPREAFVPAASIEHAYDDGPLRIGEEQTISQPYVVAAMIELLRPAPGERALEVGAGSGYAAAVLGRCVGEVWAVERFASLAASAAARMAALGIENVHIVHGDGMVGLPEHAPYDVVLVSAGGAAVPEPLIAQLAPGGRLVMPVGGPLEQRLVLVEKERDGSITKAWLDPVRFVPLLPGATS